MSSKFHHGEKTHNGYALVGGGTEAQEIICVDEAGEPRLDEAGAIIKPLDFSITKVALSVMFSSILLLLILFGVRRSCCKNAGKAPKGMQSLMEILIIFMRDGVVRPIIGEKHYERYLPYILTLFLFLYRL